MRKKRTAGEAFGSEYAMSAGDNAATRERADRSIVSAATANEHSFRAACFNRLSGRDETGE